MKLSRSTGLTKRRRKSLGVVDVEVAVELAPIGGEVLLELAVVVVAPAMGSPSWLGVV